MLCAGSPGWSKCCVALFLVEKLKSRCPVSFALCKWSHEGFICLGLGKGLHKQQYREGYGTIMLYYKEKQTLGFPYLLDFCLRSIEIIESNKRNHPTRGRNHWWKKRTKNSLKQLKLSGSIQIFDHFPLATKSNKKLLSGVFLLWFQPLQCWTPWLMGPVVPCGVRRLFGGSCAIQKMYFYLEGGIWRNSMVPGPGTRLAWIITIWWRKGAVGEAEASKIAKKNFSPRTPEEANAWISHSAVSQLKSDRLI